MDIDASGKQIFIRDEEFNKTLVDHYNDTDTDRKEDLLFTTLPVVYHHHYPHQTIRESTDGSPVFLRRTTISLHARTFAGQHNTHSSNVLSIGSPEAIPALTSLVVLRGTHQ